MENAPVQEHQNAQSESMLEGSEGGATLPPRPFSLTADGGNEGNPVAQRQEADPQPANAANNWAGLPDEYRDPLANSNTALANLQLLISEWEGRDGTSDDRKLAYILATSLHETAGTNHAIHEGFSDNYWQGRYADSGYWGRGFVQLTWEDNYAGMEDETGVDLTEQREAALLPAVSAIVTVDGMIDGDFAPGAGPLNNYITVNEDDQGNQTQGNADYYNARRTVNGTDSAQSIATRAENIATHIQAYRTGVENGSITDQSLAEYLYHETDLYTGTRESDANRVLEAMGYQEFGTPGFGSDITDAQQDYVDDVGQTGYTVASARSSIQRINSDTERGALIAFQQEFNQNHNLETPLREDGVLDDPTFAAIMRAGNLIRSGENMIDYAFEGGVQALNPVTQAFDQFQAGDTNIAGLAGRLAYLMPVPNAQDVLTMFDNLNAQAADLAFQLSLAAPSHDDLAYFNRPVLERMQQLLTSSGNPQHAVMATRVQCLFDYTPAEGQYIEYRVQSGDSLGAIASRNGMSLQELLDYNAANGNTISNPNVISIGDPILLPNPDFDPDAEGSQTCELDAFPLPDIAAPVPTPSPEPEPQAESESGSPTIGENQGEKAERMKGIFKRIGEWIKGFGVTESDSSDLYSFMITDFRP